MVVIKTLTLVCYLNLFLSPRSADISHWQRQWRQQNGGMPNKCWMRQWTRQYCRAFADRSG